MLPFIIAGLAAGSVYALSGVGLILTYKTSGVFNFANGALATVAAYLFYTLQVRHDVPWPVAAAICLLVAGPMLGLLMERIARSLTSASLATRVVSTVGILIAIQALAVIIYGQTETRTVPEYLPQHPFHVGGTIVTADRLIVFAIGIGATALLYAYFRWARLGVAMRAVVDDPDLLDLSGTNPVGVRRWAWIIGMIFVSASGILLVPYVTLDSSTLTFLVISAFGAAAIGRFSSLPLTYAGGLFIGVASSLATKYFNNGFLSGLSAALPFLILFVVLLVAPRGRLADRAPVIPRAASSWQMPWQPRAATSAAIVAVLLFVPHFAGIHLADFSSFLAITVLFLSLGLLVRTSGQVSLCHVSFMAIGACAFSHLHVGAHWPWIPALLVSGLIAMPVGALLAIPAIRLSGLYLAVATFGFGIVLEYMFYDQSYMFGPNGIVLQVPRPSLRAVGLTGSDRSYFYFCLLCAVVVSALIVAANQSRLGRLLRALSDSPKGLATSGVSVNVTRVLVFCISAFLAAVAGVLWAGADGSVAGNSFLPIMSLEYFAIIIITIGDVPIYAVLAAVGLTIVPSYVTSANTANWLQVAFGVAAVAYAVTPPAAREVPAAVRNLADRWFRRPDSGMGVAARPHKPSVLPGLQRSDSLTLQVEGLGVRFGGLVAVDNVSIQAPKGRITGLIGPNGAGKTTLFNSCSGLNRADEGQVLLGEKRITKQGASSRARLGLGRTFQQFELFESLSVWDNVALGAEGSEAGPNALKHLASSPRVKRRVNERTRDALDLCGLSHLSGRVVGSLSTGQRRLVELARALAGPFQILLLDEPSSGLDRVETANFADILRRVVADRGLGVLLVEHDMSLVTEVCDYIYVLDFGRLIFEGVPQEVMAAPVVHGAYLGGDVEPPAIEDVGPSIAQTVFVPRSTGRAVS